MLTWEPFHLKKTHPALIKIYAKSQAKPELKQRKDL